MDPITTCSCCQVKKKMFLTIVLLLPVTVEVLLIFFETSSSPISYMRISTLSHADERGRHYSLHYKYSFMTATIREDHPCYCANHETCSTVSTTYRSRRRYFALTIKKSECNLRALNTTCPLLYTIDY